MAVFFKLEMNSLNHLQERQSKKGRARSTVRGVPPGGFEKKCQKRVKTGGNNFSERLPE